MIKSESESVIQSQQSDIIINWNGSQDLFIQICICVFGQLYLCIWPFVFVYSTICICAFEQLYLCIWAFAIVYLGILFVYLFVIKSEGDFLIIQYSLGHLFDIIIKWNRSQDLFIQIWFYSSWCALYTYYACCTHIPGTMCTVHIHVAHTRNNPDLN